MQIKSKYGYNLCFWSEQSLESVRNDQEKYIRLEQEALFNSKVKAPKRLVVNDASIRSQVMEILSYCKEYSGTQKELFEKVDYKTPVLIQVIDNFVMEHMNGGYLSTKRINDFFDYKGIYCTGCSKVYSMNDLGSQYLENKQVNGCKCGANELYSVKSSNIEAFIERFQSKSAKVESVVANCATTALDEKLPVTTNKKTKLVKRKKHQVFVDVLKSNDEAKYLKVTSQKNITETENEPIEIVFNKNKEKVILQGIDFKIKTSSYYILTIENNIFEAKDVNYGGWEQYQFYLKNENIAKYPFKKLYDMKYSKEKYCFNFLRPFYYRAFDAITVIEDTEELRSASGSDILIAALQDKVIDDEKLKYAKRLVINNKYELGSYFKRNIMDIITDENFASQTRAKLSLENAIKTIESNNVLSNIFNLVELVEASCLLEDTQYYYPYNSKVLNRMNKYCQKKESLSKLAIEYTLSVNENGQKIGKIPSIALSSAMDYMDVVGASEYHINTINDFSINIVKLRKKFNVEIPVKNLEEILVYNAQSKFLLDSSIKTLPDYSILKELFLQNIGFRYYEDGVKMMKKCEELSPDGIKGRKFDIKNIISEHNMYQETLKCLMENSEIVHESFKERYAKWENKVFELNSENVSIIAPLKYEDLLIESNNLKHCLFSYNSTIAEGNEMVLFIRSNKKSLYTISVNKDGNIIHSSGYEHAKVSSNTLIEIEKFIKSDEQLLAAIEHFYNSDYAQ